MLRCLLRQMFRKLRFQMIDDNGGAAIFLGLLGLVSGDIATTWQNVDPNIPLRVPPAYLTAVVELAGGIALLLPRTARAGALTLTIVYPVFTLISGCLRPL
jgi:uncharacterized membrane protein